MYCLLSPCRTNSGIANFMMNVSTGMSGRAVRTCLSTECRFGLLSSEKITFSREPSCKIGLQRREVVETLR